MSLELRVEVLERQVKELRRELRAQSEWIDTVATPMWKRLWFVIQGYHFHKLGRWYKAPWNESASEWDKD